MYLFLEYFVSKYNLRKVSCSFHIFSCLNFTQEWINEINFHKGEPFWGMCI